MEDRQILGDLYVVHQDCVNLRRVLKALAEDHVILGWIDDPKVCVNPDRLRKLIANAHEVLVESDRPLPAAMKENRR